MIELLVKWKIFVIHTNNGTGSFKVKCSILNNDQICYYLCWSACVFDKCGNSVEKKSNFFLYIQITYVLLNKMNKLLIYK